MYHQSGTNAQKLYSPELDYSVKYIYIPSITDGLGGSENRANAGSSESENRTEAGSSESENRAEAGSSESENRTEAGSTRQPQLLDRLIGTTELSHDAGGVNSI